VLCEALTLAGIPHAYNVASNWETFQLSLGPRLYEAAQRYQAWPVVHLSMHGNESGVGLTEAGSFLSWDALREILQPIATAINGWLIITMSCCFGAAGCRMAMVEDNEHPFYALVGNNGSPTWADSAIAFMVFYHRFFAGASIEDAIEAMRMASGDQHFVGHFGHSIKADWVANAPRYRMEALLQLLTEQQTGGKP
jgi:hypothetical protein